MQGRLTAPAAFPKFAVSGDCLAAFFQDLISLTFTGDVLNPLSSGALLSPQWLTAQRCVLEHRFFRVPE